MGGTDTVRIDGDGLVLPGGVRVRFIRTLRLPETGTHALPPGLGSFPLRRVEDFPGTVPAEWLARGGVMLPVYLREAMWLHFGGTSRPAALQVGVGKVCAVSGKPWSGRLSSKPQNYLPLPDQPWLDGINSGHGTVRQFVAVPLGMGATVEGQVTGEETWGGIQLQVFGLTDGKLAEWTRLRAGSAAWPPPPGPVPTPPPYSGMPPAPAPYAAMPMPAPPDNMVFGAPPPAPGAAPGAPAPGAVPPPAPAGAAPQRSAPAMGLGAGGSMRQQVHRDTRPLSNWSDKASGRVFVHLVTPPEWRRITGEAPPPSPVDRAAYTRAGLPWFEHYDENAQDLDPSETLSGVKPVGDWLGDDHTPWVAPGPHQVVQLGDAPGSPVADGDW
ncbi:hypothetical protein [Streptomyces abyssomicinicus]|uniref:hypothetical protein n=1 Tax=Streptomyces abyssomicinicus TaxID=574929 RepID=UPI001250C472|nr:hypothetical protein [Streptomyces abyssomicinicus]